MRYLTLGAYFGFVLLKSQAASWYRIQEMFRFQSFYMYGLLISAIAVAAASVFIIKRFRLHAIDGSPIVISRFAPGFWRYALGGIVFGIGWGIVGICPGPIAALIGAGYFIAIVVAAASVFVIKRFNLRAIDGSPIVIEPFPPGLWRYALGGVVFGLGWGLAGICPGPIAALIGAGYSIVIVVLASAMLGTWACLAVQKHLPQ